MNDRRVVVLCGVIVGCAMAIGDTQSAAAAPRAADSPPACTADAISADTGLPLRPEVVCSAGFAMAMLAPPDPATGGPSATINETNSCTSIETCGYPQIFHVTTSGWVYDGVHGRTCAEQLDVYFMSPQTAATFAPICEPETWPAPETVQEGDQGAAVMFVQIALVSSGYEEAVDGSFGSGTTEAVVSFQHEHGLEMNGIVGPETHALLGTGPNPPLPPTTTTTVPPAIAPGTPHGCDAATISADTGLTVVAIRVCAAGWAQGMLSTTCTGTDPEAECEDADVFHVTENGWVHVGTFYAYCAEHLAERSGMSVYTAMEITYTCGEFVPPPRSNIEPGTSGQGVSQLQIALVALGYPIAVDGEYGPRTELAVQDFQQRNGLEADGIAGAETQDALGI